MYKIYINDTPLFLAGAGEAGKRAADGKNIVARYMGNPRIFLGYLDMLEKNTRFDSVTVYSDDADKLFEAFAGWFKLVEAAGGLVYNDEQEVLLIFRRGYWDLPKGKIDKGESREDAAVREVMEETGLSGAALGDYLGPTYHTYRDRKLGRVLKRTYWYRMKAKKEALVPQHEEDIEQAEWRHLGSFLESDPVMYGNIRDILLAELAV